MANFEKVFKLIGVAACAMTASELMTAVGEGKMMAKVHQKDPAKVDLMLTELDGKDDLKSKVIRKTARKLIEEQKKNRK